MVVLAYLRGRPWLAPCLMLTGLGMSVLAISRLGYLLIWAGTLLLVGGLLGLLICELGHRRERAGQVEDHE